MITKQCGLWISVLKKCSKPKFLHVYYFFISFRFAPLMGYDLSKEERMRKEGVTFIPTILHPKSRGEVRLRNTDPNSPPIIDPHYLEDEHDVKVLAEVIRSV